MYRIRSHIDDVDSELGEVGDHGDVLRVGRRDLRVLHQLREVLLRYASLLKNGGKFKSQLSRSKYRVVHKVGFVDFFWHCFGFSRRTLNN